MTKRKILALAALAAFSLVACSDEDNNQNTPAPDKSVPKDLGSDAKDGSRIDAKGDAASTAPYISSIIPSDGLASGGKSGAGTPVLISGRNFKQGITVYMDGAPQSLVVAVPSSVAVSFTIPKNDYGNTVRMVDIMLGINNEFSNVKTFTYTVTKDMTTDYKGSIVTTTGEAYADYPSPTAYEGKVYIKGLTNTETKESKKIRAEVGYGKQDSTTKTCPDPSQEAGWRWYSATWSKADSTTGYHHYTSNPTVTLALTYCMAYRFSYDPKGFGQFGEYVYADSDETDLKFDLTKTGTLTASAAPADYCLKSSDCYDALKVACKLSTSSWKLHKCVACLTSTDCLNNKNAYGALCDTSKDICYCKADTDCKDKLLGYVCVNSLGSGYKACGCSKDTNCPVGLKCLQTSSGATICGTPSP